MLKLPIFQKFSTKRRNSLTIPRIPYTLSSQIKNPTALPKLVTSSRNYETSKAENEPTEEKINHLNENQSLSEKIFKDEPIIDTEVSNFIYISANKNILKGEINIPSIIKLPTPNESNFDQIFKEKIKICNYIFDFSNSQIQAKGKKEKLTALTEINYIISNKSEAQLLTSNQQDLLLNMISKNIFDQDPFISNSNKCLLITKANVVERSWEHFSIVYKILNQYVLLFPKKCQIDLVKKAVRLMNIPDINERENLVTFLKNYTKVHSDQFDDIWKIVKSALTNVRYKIYTPYCIDPLISYVTQHYFLCSTNIYIKILYTHLLPLFKHDQLFQYFTKLINLIIELVENDPTNQINTVQYLIKYFPRQFGSKQPLFASALVEIIQMMNFEDLNSISTKVLNFVALTVCWPNTKLVDIVLNLFTKQNMKLIICSNYEFAMETLYEPLKWCSSFYWDKSVREQSRSALSILMNAKMEFQANSAMCDFILCSELPTDSSPSSDENNRKMDNKELASVWASISRTAAKKDSSIDLTKSLFNIQVAFVRNNNNNEITYLDSKIEKVPSIRPKFSNINNLNQYRNQLKTNI